MHIFEVRHSIVLGLSKTSTKFVQTIPWGKEMAPPWGHMFYIGLYRENMKNNLLV